MSEISPTEEELEKINFARVYLTFKLYKEKGLEIFQRKERFISRLPNSQRQKLALYQSHLKKLQSCLEKNDEIIQMIIKDAHCLFFDEDDYANLLSQHMGDLQPYDFDRLKIVLKQLVREWTIEGSRERDCAYSPIIEEIVSRFPPNKSDPENVKVLVPGSGLGRLPFEIACRGYSCEGNDFSLFMLFVSNFILNRCGKGINKFTFHPHIHTLDNCKNNQDQLESYSFPDVNPRTLICDDSRITMTCGEFIEIYSKRFELWDCVATCFFIDCPANIVLVIEVIYQILKQGGVWINNGPLRYHYAESDEEDSIELPYEEVKRVIQQTGFIYQKDTEIPATYTANPNSLAKFYYNSLYFVCVKPNKS